MDDLEFMFPHYSKVYFDIQAILESDLLPDDFVKLLQWLIPKANVKINLSAIGIRKQFKFYSIQFIKFRFYSIF